MPLATDSPWQAIVSVALMGTERQSFQPPSAAGKLGEILLHLQEKSPEAALLSAAATVALHRQAGWVPEHRSVLSLEPCPTDDLPRCSLRATWCLQQMLQGQYSQLLPEWLALVANAAQRVPEMSLPDLLDLGRQQRDLQAAILPVLGQRGRWLATQNPDWSYAVELITDENWQTGNAAARLLYLQHLRATDPDRARERLMEIWSQEAAAERGKLLETLRIGLSIADESFLEAALNDRSKEVRRVAADLLASLINSRLCQYMAKQSQQHLTLLPGQPPSLMVQLPAALDSTLIQYGIESKPTQQLPGNLGEKGWWLLQMLAATPLSRWSETWGMTVAEIVQLAQKHEWEVVLIEGWTLAAKRQTDRIWMEALLKNWLDNVTRRRLGTWVGLSLESLLDVLDADQHNAFLMHLLHSEWGGFSASTATHLLLHHRTPWSFDLMQVVLTQLEDYLPGSNNMGSLNWELRTRLKEFACFIPPACLSEFTSRMTNLKTQLPDNSPWQFSLEELFSLLQFRQELLQAFESR